MLAAAVTRFDDAHPLAGLDVSQQPEPEERPGWTVVTVDAASLNHHDLWSLRGAGLTAEQLPMILGTDAVGHTSTGRQVVVHPVIGSSSHARTAVFPHEPRSLLSERHPGTLAERVAVPTGNLVDLPSGLDANTAACLPTAWVTTYRMLFREAALRPGQSVLIQGASGGLASAAITLAAAAGVEVVATGRTETKREYARTLGADIVLEHGARLPHRVDAVIESVGAATWRHSLRAVRAGGTIVVAGVTTGEPRDAELRRIFAAELTVRGVMVGDLTDLTDLLAFVGRTGVRPHIDSAVALTDVADGLARLAAGKVTGKVVVHPQPQARAGASRTSGASSKPALP